MTIIERIISSLEEQEKTMSELCKFLDINTSTMATWKTRNTEPPAKYLVRICEFLNVSLEWLLTGNHSLSSASLSDSEVQLLQLFRSLDPTTQHHLIGMLNGISSKVSSTDTKEPSFSHLNH